MKLFSLHFLSPALLVATLLPILAISLHTNADNTTSNSFYGQSESLQTEYLKPQVGSREPKLGAYIVAIDNVPDDKAVRIEIAIPQEQEDILIEEMLVYGVPLEQPDLSINNTPEIAQVRKFEFVKDIEQGQYGLVLYLPKTEDFAIKFNYRNLSQEQQTGFAPASLEHEDKGR